MISKFQIIMNEKLLVIVSLEGVVLQGVARLSALRLMSGE